LAVRLIDTAGILECRDAIEEEALARTNKALNDADLVLFVLDGSMPLTREDKMLADKVGQKKCVVIMNKADQKHRVSAREIKDIFSREPIEVSALTGQHIDKLEDAIAVSVFGHGNVCQEGVVVSNARHIEILRRVQHHLELSCETLKKGLSLEFVAMDAGKALEALGELTGEVFNEDILDEIFSKFCIGK
jgi:tRNA modification GTPase